MIQWNTILSELLLVLFMLYLTYSMKYGCIRLSITCSLVVGTAFFGILRLICDDPPAIIYNFHMYFTTASFLFVPSLIASAYISPISYIISFHFVFIPCFLLVTKKLFNIRVLELTVKILAVMSFGVILIVSYYDQNKFGIVGISLFLLAIFFLVFSIQVNFLKPIDLFHLVLIPAIYSLKVGACGGS